MRGNTLAYGDRKRKVYLTNSQTLGAMCGYGEGQTSEEAIADALRKARAMDPDAYYQGGTVWFRGGVNS
jgi:hypothetical protein